MLIKFFVVFVTGLLFFMTSSFAAAQVSETPSRNTMFGFSVTLSGVGTSGNANPLRPYRALVVDVWNSQNQLIVTRVGRVAYNSAKGTFDGDISIGLLTPGVYTVKVKTNSYLQKTVPGIVTIRQEGGYYALPKTSLSAGDVIEDNQTNILDYNVVMGCFSDLTPAKRCNATARELADFNDDGKVNQIDYNLFLRELASIRGA